MLSFCGTFITQPVKSVFEAPPKMRNILFLYLCSLALLSVMFCLVACLCVLPVCMYVPVCVCVCMCDTCVCMFACLLQ